MTRRRQLGPAEPCADLNSLLCVLRDNLGRADAFITTAEDLIERPRSGNSDEDRDESEDDILRLRSHIEYLVESAKLAVRAAAYTSTEIEGRVRRQRGRDVRAGDDVRAFLARVLGWSDERTVELAQRSLTLALEHRAVLVLYGEGNLVPIAWALHRRTLGADRPFIVCDPRRGRKVVSVRSPASHGAGVAAFEAAIGGSLCVRMRRLPHDFPALVARLRQVDDVLCAICAGPLAGAHWPLVLPAPITVPSLAHRAADLDRIIAEYAGDAIAELRAPASSFAAADHRWVRDHAAASLAEIEKATIRLVTVRTSRNRSHAAARLGMAAVSLSR